jgi:hypothetical protein
MLRVKPLVSNEGFTAGESGRLCTAVMPTKEATGLGVFKIVNKVL